MTSSSFASYGVKPEELSDRCSITVTSLLAMVAFKYIISSKLPDINYPTLIDYYVLLCFVIDFLVVLLQVLSALGIIEEPVYQYQVCRNVNTTNNFMSSDICGISAGSVISPGLAQVECLLDLTWCIYRCMPDVHIRYGTTTRLLTYSRASLRSQHRSSSMPRRC